MRLLKHPFRVDGSLRRRRLLQLTGGAVATGLAGCSGQTGGADTDTATPAGTTPTPTEAMTDTGTAMETESGPTSALVVEDQRTDGTTVTVPRAVIDGTGWLVIHPEAEGGGPDGGVVLAKRLIEPGTYTDVELELPESISMNQTLYAMLHYDDPADGEFTFPASGDPPVVVDGSPVIKPFATTVVGRSLDVADQETDGTTVTVPRAVIDDTGWLVIHPEAEGGGPNGGVVLAGTTLEPGTYVDVELTIEEPLAEDQTLYAMLHYDDPADGEFTFPERGDPPVVANGSPVIRPFDVTVVGRSLDVADQETDGTAVTVPRAVIDRTGWLVIHPEAEGGGPNGGVVLAKRLIDPGTYVDVELTIEEPLAEDQTLYAMLHYDDPADGEFTFPERGDPPVVSNGSPVIEPFAATVTGRVTATVTMQGTRFHPERLSVDPGTTVEWVNEDGYGHDVTAASFHGVAAYWSFSERLSGGDRTSYTFEEPGVYEYYCSIHGRSVMCGVVLVGDATLDEELPCEGGSEGY